MPNGEVGHRSKDTILRVVQVQIYKLFLKKQLKIVNFQSVHEIKTVEEKLLKKTKSKLFNI